MKDIEKKHFLEFVSLGMTELYEICEPIGFNPNAKFVREQESQRYARSYEYFAVDQLEFPNESSDILITRRAIDLKGTTSDRLDYGFNLIIASLKKKGLSAKIYYHCYLNGVFFPSFQLELQEEDLTDWRTYVKCKLIQNDKVEEIKRKLDDKVNLFSTQDYKGNTITPSPTINILRKGLIETKNSKIVLTEQKAIFTKAQGLGTDTLSAYFNPAIDVVNSNLKHTVTHIEDISIENPNNNPEDLYYYIAQKETFNLKVSIKNLLWNVNVVEASNGFCDFQFFIRAGYSAFGDEFYSNNIVYVTLDNEGQNSNISINDSYTIPYLPVGAKVYIYFYIKTRKSNAGLGAVRSATYVSPYEIELSADVKALDLVFPAVRYIDFLKQSLKSINGHQLIAPLFDVNGKHYDQVVWTKKMITGKTDEFYTTPKEALESVQEVNCDYELNNNFCFIGQDEDYYVKEEIGYFDVVPDKDITSKFNAKASIKKIVYKYNTYSNDRDVKNSDKVVHGESEWSSNVDLGKTDFERDFKQIRDSIQEQDAVDLETKKPTVLTDREDKFYLRTITELAPNTKSDITFRLLMQSNGSTRKVLNYSLETGEEQDLGINWLSMGLSIGQEVQINNEVWTVTEIEQETTDSSGQIISGGRMITFLAPSSLNFQGDITLRFQYTYLGVLYTTKTTQGFEEISGVSETFGNLDYTPKRNIEYFKKLLAISAIKNDDLKISVVQYKNNGSLKTRKLIETEFIIENEPILKSDLPNPYISDLIYNVKLAVSFEDAVNYFKEYQNKRGFITCLLPTGEILKGFPKKIEYNLNTYEMNISELEQLFEGEYLEIITQGDYLFVNDVKYAKSGNLDWFEFRNNDFRVYNEKSKPISNWYDFKLVILNGVSYTDKDELDLALQNG